MCLKKNKDSYRFIEEKRQIIELWWDGIGVKKKKNWMICFRKEGIENERCVRKWSQGNLWVYWWKRL